MVNLKFFSDILEANKDNLENIKLCKDCGGLCCKKSGCSFLPFDVEMTTDGIKRQIDLGDTSITVSVYFDIESNKSYNFPILTLRSRNRKRGAIDLISEKTRCASLTNTGCKFSKEERPSGALSLIPRIGGLNGSIETSCYNVFEEYQREILESWMPYQKELLQVVENETGAAFENEYKKQLLLTYKKIKEDKIEGYTLSDSALQLFDTFNYMDMAIIQSKLGKETRSTYIETPKMRTYFRPYRMK